MAREKPRISATIDEDLKEQLDSREEINKSQLIETLLREYLAHGESTTVALKVRREQLRNKKQSKKIRKQTIASEIESIDDQIEEITKKIQERQKQGLEGVSELVEKVKNGEMNPEFIDSSNPIVREKASKAGVPPERFAKEVQEKL